MSTTDKEKLEQLSHWRTGVGKASPYLGSWSLPNFENIQVTIVDVKKEMTTGLKDNAICNILYFKEKIKPMILNATNAKTLRAISGSPFIEKWIGTTIELRVERDLKAFGEVVDALRIVNKKIKTVLPKLDKTHPKFEEIVGRILDGSAQRDVVAKYYELTKDFEDAIQPKSMGETDPGE